MPVGHATMVYCHSEEVVEVLRGGRCLVRSMRGLAGRLPSPQHGHEALLGMPIGMWAAGPATVTQLYSKLGCDSVDPEHAVQPNWPG